MDFFKKLFGGFAPPSQRMVVYVKPKMCQEVLRIELDLLNSSSQTDDGSGYYLRKLARGERCPFEVEMEFHFNKNRQLIERSIQHGDFVDEADYQAFINQRDNKV